ncbi:5298_t:CDS:2 [Racocetra fulgida]|uniref:5298_t:CDS:1 n=1 Tax=Racocetra fulgida TaxID=60492 RepID=A0A9N9AP39_9GLOM|nr:5298_t:CDS:2 [Racocetra fulgida]
MTHPTVHRNYQQTSPYYTELPTPATTSRAPQQQLQPPQNLPGTFPNTRNVYHPPTSSTDATPLPQYQLNPQLHSHVPLTQSPTSPPLTPFMPETNGPKVPGSRSELKGVLRKERYEYKAPWPVYGLDWSKRPGEKSFRLALGSFIEENANKLQIITLSEFAYDDSYYRNPNVDLVKIAETDHRYPITKVLWEPYKGGLKTPDLLATAGDYLRLWEVEDDFNTSSNTIGANNFTGVRQQRLTHKSMLTNTKADFNAPLTSFDWNEIDPTLAVTSSIDTTCTVWNVETKQAKTQLIAHDKEVYDVAFASGTVDVFASVGADEHSTIIYETVNPHPPSVNAANTVLPSPLLRLCFNKMEPNYLATFHMDSLDVQILDVRVPGVPVAELRGDDSQVLVWNINGVQMGGVGGKPYNNDPILSYKADSEISQLSWSSRYPDWVAIGFGNTVQALRM